MSNARNTHPKKHFCSIFCGLRTFIMRIFRVSRKTMLRITVESIQFQNFFLFAARKEAIQDVQQLNKLCKYELCSIQLCAECFVRSRSSNDYEWFPKVCLQPHLLVWAKLSGYPYWPAKVMSVNSDDSADEPAVLTVQFFGEHKHAFVPAKDCFLYSWENPNGDSGKKFQTRHFSDCVDEAKQYIDNIIAKFGHFNYAAYKTPVVPNNLERYVSEMTAGRPTNLNRSIPMMQNGEAGINVASTSASSLGAWPNTSTRRVTPIKISRKAIRKNPLNSLRLNASSTATREAMFAKKIRKEIEDAKAGHYKTKYANIIENPGTLLLHRCDSTTSLVSEPSESTSPQLDAIASHFRFDANARSATPMELTPFAESNAIGNTMDIPSISIQPTVAGTSSSTNDIFNPLPSTSAQALPQVRNPPQPINTEDMANRLNDMIKAANEKMASLQNDWRAISNHAAELKAGFDKNKATYKSQCVNCGKPARLFCTWSTSYCDVPCRDQHR